jgi:hypothetical protein
MAGVLLIRRNIGFSCSTRAFMAVLRGMEEVLGGDSELGAIFENADAFGNLSVMGRPDEEVLRFLTNLKQVAARLRMAQDPPVGWPYSTEYWPTTSAYMAEVESFADHTISLVEAERSRES